jgi:hypothetical protein
MRRYRRRRRDGDFITAAEMGSYVFCKEQWRLQYVLGMKPGNRAALDAGTRHHARKAVAERVAGGSIGIGRLLVGVALAVLLLLWWVWR